MTATTAPTTTPAPSPAAEATKTPAKTAADGADKETSPKTVLSSQDAAKTVSRWMGLVLGDLGVSRGVC